MSAVFAIASPRRIKASHRRRRKIAVGRFVQRYYDPAIGRFLSSDPAESEFNHYNYAANNPYRFFDPDGRATADPKKPATPQPDAPQPECNIECKRQRQAERNAPSNGVFGDFSWDTVSGAAADFAASHPLSQGVVDGANGLGTGIVNGASFGFADGEHFFDKAETPEYLALRDSGTVLGAGAGGGAFARVGAAGGRYVLGKMVTSPTFGPAGTVFGRARLGGSSWLNINANNTLRVGWGWKGDAQTGTHVFRVVGKIVEKIKQSGHIDLWP